MGYGKHSVRYLGPVLWSKIDRKFRELKMLYEFKRKIRMADLAKHINFYLIIVLTVLFVILNIVIIFKLWVGLLRGSYRDYMGTFSF